MNSRDGIPTQGEERCASWVGEEKTKFSGLFPILFPSHAKLYSLPNIYRLSTAGWCQEKGKEEHPVFTFKKFMTRKMCVNAVLLVWFTQHFCSPAKNRVGLYFYSFCFLTVECVHASASDTPAEGTGATSRWKL